MRREPQAGQADGPLRAVPVERIAGADGLTLKRGCTTTRIDGEHASEIVGAVLDLTRDAELTEDELVALFPVDAQGSIRSLVGELRARRLLLPADSVADATAESQLDVFYWHFGQPDEPSPSPPRNERVAVVGGNRTAARLGALLDEAGFGDVVTDAADDLDGDGPLPSIVALVSETGFGPLRPWNERLLEREVPFLPVVIDDLVVYVGPLVVPHQTACFECFLRRRYSNLDEAVAREAVELRPTGARIVGLHPAISTVAAGVAALELSKFFLPLHAARQAGHLLTFNLLASRGGRHRVLKVPRCPACSSLKTPPPRSASRVRLTRDAV